MDANFEVPNSRTFRATEIKGFIQNIAFRKEPQVTDEIIDMCFPQNNEMNDS
jgi:hypothetical protein